MSIFEDWADKFILEIDKVTRDTSLLTAWMVHHSAICISATVPLRLLEGTVEKNRETLVLSTRHLGHVDVEYPALAEKHP
uniref:Uncharacterized protein n=1 Tax=Oryza sativa subsp. japonica TaxID=39947 RepID=Q6Z5L5_ORYSJ|nr:hypothetical protein [Oryza sativa Japonica Group]